MRRIVLAVPLFVACGPAPARSEGEGQGTQSDVTSVAGTTSDRETSVGQTGESGDGSTTTSDEPHVGCFVSAPPDVGSDDYECEQPEPRPQPSGCGDGVKAPGELCYQGAAARCLSRGGFGGFALADFGAGPAIAYPAEYEDAEVRLLPATIEGLLGPPCVVRTAQDPVGVAARDVDGDGWQDLIVAHDEWPSMASSIAVQRGHGVGVFEPWISSNTESAQELRWAENDGSVPIDIIARETWGYESPRLNFFTSSDDGTFTLVHTISLGIDVIVYSIADLDGDGLSDVVAFVLVDWTNNDYISEIQVVMGSAGDLAAPSTLVPSGALPLGPPVAGRFDGDDVPDVVYTVDGRIVLRSGLGDGTFAAPLETGLQPDDYGIAAIDVDGDGHDELVGGSDIISFSSEGLPLVHATFDKGNHHYPFRLAEAAELNGDGLLDIVLMTEGGQEPPAIHLVLSNP